MRVLLAACLLFASMAATAAPPRVALVYSAWGGYAFREEMDAHLNGLGLRFDKFENRDAARLAARLDEFDMVVSCGVGNYDNPQDMGAFRAEWLRFLERGGALVITDASYGSVLDQWVNRLGPDVALSSAACAHPADAAGLLDLRCDPRDALLHTPHDLARLLPGKANIWAHMTGVGPGWRRLVNCPDGGCLYAAREVGKGLLVVTSFYSFKGVGDGPLVAALLDNIRARTAALRLGLQVTRFDVGPARPGRRTVALAIRNTAARPLDARLQLLVTEGSEPAREACSRTVRLPGGSAAELRLPCTVASRGRCRIEALVNGAPLIDRSQDIPAAVALTMPLRSVGPATPRLPFSAAFAPDGGVDLAACTAELLVDGRRVWRKAGPGEGVSATIGAASLKPGEHRAVLRLRSASGVLGEAEARFTTFGPGVAFCRPDGTLLVGGKPFFPFGWYHVSWPFTTRERLDFLRDVAAGGFNAVHAGVKQADEWVEFLDEAQRLGVKVGTEFGVEPLGVIQRFKGHPAVLTWNPGDEPDGQGVTPDEMARRMAVYKAADPGHPVYMTLCVPSTYRLYAAAADVLAPDPYPIPSAPLGSVTTSLRAARQAGAPYGHPVWGILQCFGYAGGPWRVPTFEECRCMTYLALVAGVKGILYYTYADTSFKVTEHPALWADMKTLPAELKAMEPFLLEGALTELPTGSPDLYAAQWRMGRRTMLCVVNSSQKEARAVAVKAAGRLTGGARNLVPGRPWSLALAGNSVRGTLQPMEVAVCEVGPAP